MADPVNDVVKAPKQVVAFAEEHLIAFVLLLLLVAVLFTVAETRRPGSITTRVRSAPLLGTVITRLSA